MPVTTEVRVRYAETDQMGIVYYANYLVWFEIGRVELLRSLGLAYSQLEIEHECILPVIEASCRYRSPARYDDEIQIETRPALLRGSVMKAPGRRRNGARGLRRPVKQKAPARKIRRSTAANDGCRIDKPTGDFLPSDP